MRNRSFASLHPIVLFLYFVILMGFTMFVNDPINMMIAFVLSHAVYMFYGSKKEVILQIIYSISIVLLIGLTNMIFVHQGVTILFYYNNNPITLEALYYGLAFGAMIASILTQCRILHHVMDSDKVLYLFARFTPIIALILAMTLRLIPKFQRQAKTIIKTQQTLGVNIYKGSLIWRIRVATMVFSMMITWAFEHGVKSANSMKARGFGSHRRTSYACYTWSMRDTYIAVVVAVFTIIMVLAAMHLFTHFYYYPNVTNMSFDKLALCSYGSYILLFMIPIVLEGRDYYLWNYVRVKN